MTNSEKMARVSVLISPDTASTDLLTYLVEQAEGIVLNRLHPFGVPEGAVVPARYENVLIRIAVELYSKMGADGQTSHDENGIRRVWESGDVSPSLLKQIVPYVGSVRACEI